MHSLEEFQCGNLPHGRQTLCTARPGICSRANLGILPALGKLSAHARIRVRREAFTEGRGVGNRHLWIRHNTPGQRKLAVALSGFGPTVIQHQVELSSSTRGTFQVPGFSTVHRRRPPDLVSDADRYVASPVSRSSLQIQCPVKHPSTGCLLYDGATDLSSPE
jgi:hypothetical protein